MFKLWLYAYQTKARNPGNAEAAKNSVFELLMTSNDLQVEFFLLLLYAHQTKARNPGKTVKANNSLFDLLMTSNDL